MPPEGKRPIPEEMVAGPYSDVDAYREMFQAEADVANRRRTILDRLLRRSAVTGAERARLRAEQYDQALEETLPESQRQDEEALANTIGAIESRDDFALKSREQTERLAYLEESLGKVLDAIELKEGHRIRESYTRLLKDLESSPLTDTVRESIRNKVVVAIERHANELRNAALGDIQTVLGNDLHWYGDRDEYVRRRDWWAELGIVDAKEVNMLPYVQHAAELALCQGLVHPAYDTDIEKLIASRDRWVSAGVFTEEEANALPLIRNKAYEEIAKVRGPRAEQLIDGWVRAGVVTREEAGDWS